MLCDCNKTKSLKRNKRASGFLALLKNGCSILVAMLLVFGNVSNAMGADKGQEKQELTLEDAIKLAIKFDPYTKGSQLKQASLLAQSVASGQIPDPKLSISMMNLPTDTWQFNQENMTQLAVSVSQVLPKGDTLSLKQNQLQVKSFIHNYQRQNRKALVQKRVTELWLDAYIGQQTITLIEQDRDLFEQMLEAASANYANAVGNTRQQDVIRSSLELAQLDDRLTLEFQSFEQAKAELQIWLSGSQFLPVNDGLSITNIKLPAALPDVTLTTPIDQKLTNNANYLMSILSQHPLFQELEIKQQISNFDIELANQQTKVQWGVNASYGYRQDMDNGVDRADLFSIGLTMELPLFANNKQDQLVAASISDANAIKTEKTLLLRKLYTLLTKELVQLNRQSQRQTLYNQDLLRQSQDQVAAAFTAYTNDDGDFSDVVESRGMALNARLMSLQINVERLKSIARINYLLTQSQLSEQGDES